MLALMAIWWASAIIALASFVLLAFLVFRRLSTSLFGRYRRERRERLLDALTDIVNSADPLQALKSRGRWSRPDLDCALALRALRGVIRGRRDAMIEQLRRLGLDDVCRRELSSGNEEEQIAATDLIRQLGDRRYVQVLKETAEKEVPEVRDSMVRLLLDWDEVPSVEWLLRVMDVGEKRPNFETEALFRRIKVPVFYWKRKLADPQSPAGVKVLAIYALAHAGGAQEREIIMKMLSHDVPDVRAQSLRVLGLMQAQEARPGLGRLLRDPVWFVRAQAAFCCGQLGAEEYVPRLLLLLNSDYWWERYRAALALYRLGDRGRAALRDAVPFAGRPGRTASIVLAEFGVAG